MCEKCPGIFCLLRTWLYEGMNCNLSSGYTRKVAPVCCFVVFSLLICLCFICLSAFPSVPALMMRLWSGSWCPGVRRTCWTSEPNTRRCIKNHCTVPYRQVQHIHTLLLSYVHSHQTHTHTHVKVSVLEHGVNWKCCSRNIRIIAFKAHSKKQHLYLILCFLCLQEDTDGDYGKALLYLCGGDD